MVEWMCGINLINGMWNVWKMEHVGIFNGN